MAYAVKRPGGRFELRESVTTSRGPRSRTLASFRQLTPEVAQHALERAQVPVPIERLRRAARRVGAPVALEPADAAAAALLAELDSGRQPSRRLARAVVSALGERGRERESTDDERAAAPWLAATPAERGETLRQLLLLTDSLPARREGELRFPGVRTRPA